MISRETLIGILITISFHLLLALVVVSIRMRELRQTEELRLEMNIAPEVVETPKDQKMVEVNKEILEQIYAEINKQQAHDKGNTSVNVSEKFKEDLSTQKYIQRMQQELGVKATNVMEGDGSKQSKILEDASGSANENNSIRELYAGKKPIKGKRVIYKGPTNIYYDLPGRHDVNMIVPVYKCQGSGKVVVNILVDRLGKVTQADVDRAESIAEECFIDAAYKAAILSRFNTDTKAVPSQQGVITYQFIAQ